MLSCGFGFGLSGMGGPKSVVGAGQPPLISLSKGHDLVDREQSAVLIVREDLRVVETSADETPLEHEMIRVRVFWRDITRVWG